MTNPTPEQDGDRDDRRLALIGDIAMGACSVACFYSLNAGSEERLAAGDFAIAAALIYLGRCYHARAR